MQSLHSKHWVRHGAAARCGGDGGTVAADPPVGPPGGTPLDPNCFLQHHMVLRGCAKQVWGGSGACLHGFGGERKRSRWDPKQVRAEIAGGWGCQQGFCRNRLGIGLAGISEVAFWIDGLEGGGVV